MSEKRIEIKVQILDKYKDKPGVAQWIGEIEEEMNSKEFMETLDVGLAIILGAGEMGGL